MSGGPGVKSGPEDSPYLDGDNVSRPLHCYWGTGEEKSLVAVLEAHRRLTVETGDSRTAAALTLAWAAHFARP